LRRDYDSLEFRDGEAVEEFALRLQGMVSQPAVLGNAVQEEVVKKYLRIVPKKYEQVAVSIETMLDLANISIEEVIGQLMAAEDRFARRATARFGARDGQRRAALHACRVDGAHETAGQGRFLGLGRRKRRQGAREGAKEEGVQAAARQGPVPTVRQDRALGKGVPGPAQDAQGRGESRRGRRRRGNTVNGHIL
jgi:hypothetical protein